MPLDGGHQKRRFSFACGLSWLQTVSTVATGVSPFRGFLFDYVYWQSPVILTLFRDEYQTGLQSCHLRIYYSGNALTMGRCFRSIQNDTSSNNQ